LLACDDFLLFRAKREVGLAWLEAGKTLRRWQMRRASGLGLYDLGVLAWVIVDVPFDCAR
jgi:hypothetical protein